jgi:hypothetical protein
VSRTRGALLVIVLSSAARAEPLATNDILDSHLPVRIESVRVRYTQIDQEGHGWQSQAGPHGHPGSEELNVYQPQLEVIAQQGDKLTHRLWVPLDIVTAASPDALDAVSTASYQNEAGSLELATTYHHDRRTDALVHVGLHVEEQLRSWNFGLGVSRVLADGNAVIAASVNQVLDWFDRFDIHGDKLGLVWRSSTNGNLALTQVLTPTTVAHVNYGFTAQTGELGNTWNAVPLESGELGGEVLPRLRHRHAFVGRLAQWLPWRGVVKGFYRFYVDNWGLTAHTVEIELYQRITPFLYLRGNYRLHAQSGVDFFTTRAIDDGRQRTADSDLAPFVAHTVGIKAAMDLRVARQLRNLHLDVGYERYFRTNDLRANVYTCSLGFVF